MTEQNDQNDQNDDIETYSTTHDADGTEKQPTSTTTTPPATDAAAPAAETPKPTTPDTPNTPADGEDEGPRPGETPQQTAARTRSRLQVRIDKLTEARYREQGRADRLEQELAEARKARPSADPATPDADDQSGDKRRAVDPNDPAADFTQPVPTPENFNSYEEFLDARDQWRDARNAHVYNKQTAEQRARDARDARAQNVRKVVDDFRKRTPDYDAVMAKAGEVALPQVAISAMEESDHGAAIAYHLVKNPAEAEAFFALSPMAQVKRIGQLESRFAPEQRSPAPKPKPVTSAPDPIAPIGGAGASPSRSLEDLDTDDYVDEMNKRDREGRRRR